MATTSTDCYCEPSIKLSAYQNVSCTECSAVVHMPCYNLVPEEPKKDFRCLRCRFSNYEPFFRLVKV